MKLPNNYRLPAVGWRSRRKPEIGITLQDFEIGITLLAERTPSSGDFLFEGQVP